LSETLVIFGTAVTILLALRFRDAPSGRRAVAMGVACALLALTRAEQILLLGFLLCPVVLLASGTTWRRRLSWLAAATAAALAVLVPWVGFNLARFDKPTYLTSNFGSTFAESNCDATYRGPDIGYWQAACASRPVAELGLSGGFEQTKQLAARHLDDSDVDAA